MGGVADLAPEVKLARMLAGHAHFCSVASDPRDPYPQLAAARRATPVRLIDTEAGASALAFRHDDVAALLRDADRFSSSILTEAFGVSGGAPVIVSLEGDAHRIQRALVASPFGPRALRDWEQELLPRIAAELIERFAARGAADLVAELAFDLPAQAIAGILGLPRADFARFQAWTGAILDHDHHAERGAPAAAELRAYLAQIVEARRSEPRRDLISDLLAAQCEGRALGLEEIFTFVRMLLPAGVETTYRAIGNLLYLLLANAEQLGAVRGDPRLVDAAVDEALRFEVPMLITNRIAARDAELAGVKIPAGASVLAVIGAANRDEARYEAPDRFDLRRARRPHISFGAGPHVCLGMHLARAEMRAALRALLERFAVLELVDPEQQPGIVGQIFRSPPSLRVRLGRGEGGGARLWGAR